MSRVMDKIKTYMKEDARSMSNGYVAKKYSGILERHEELIEKAMVDERKIAHMELTLNMIKETSTDAHTVKLCNVSLRGYK